MIIVFRILYLSVSSYEAYNFENIFFKHESVLNRDQDGIRPKNGLHCDPLLLSTSTDILHTVLYTYRMVLPRGICLTIKSFITW